jgi:glucose-6-phosphate 1-dehydrogenase
MDAQHIRDEKVKLLRAVYIPTPDEAVDKSVRAQYLAGVVNQQAVPAYREEEGVAPDSTTETYVALRLRVENWRWAGVPVYIRTGKRLPARVTEVALVFHSVPFLAFEGELSRQLTPNTLVLRIQPNEGISLRFGAKVPGEAFRVQTVAMDFEYDRAFTDNNEADGYPRLLYDAMIGDATLFIRSDEVEQAWRIVDPYLTAWAEPGGGLHFYNAGTWGPHIADLLLERSGDSWRDPLT